MNRISRLAAMILLGAAPRVSASGLAMRFIDVTLENVEPGASFNLRALKNLPMVIINLDNENGTDIAIESVLPQAREMKDGYEPIPDPSWVKVVPDRFHLGPKASAAADIIVQLPNDPQYTGRHFEVILWAHADTKNRKLPNGGVIIQPGLRSRFRLSIGKAGPASLQREKSMKKLSTINANFSVNPDNIFTQNIATGRRVDLRAENKASLKIINQSDDPVALKMDVIPPDPNITPQAGYENAPDYKWLEVSPAKIKVPGNSIKEIKLFLTIPNKPEYRGKKYMFLVQTSLAEEDLPLAYYNMIYITTQP